MKKLILKLAVLSIICILTMSCEKETNNEVQQELNLSTEIDLDNGSEDSRGLWVCQGITITVGPFSTTVHWCCPNTMCIPLAASPCPGCALLSDSGRDEVMKNLSQEILVSELFGDNFKDETHIEVTKSDTVNLNGHVLHIQTGIYQISAQRTVTLILLVD